MATALGRRFNAVRDVRRTFRAGLWLIAIVLPPYWLLLWHTGEIMRAFGQSDEQAELGEQFMRAYMWLVAPWLLFQLLPMPVAQLVEAVARRTDPRTDRMAAEDRPVARSRYPAGKSRRRLLRARTG